MKESIYLSISTSQSKSLESFFPYTFTRTSCSDVAALNINSNLITRCFDNEFEY
jgi:hypothetical protein